MSSACMCHISGDCEWCRQGNEIKRLEEVITERYREYVALLDENKKLRDALKIVAWDIEASAPQSMIMKDTARKALTRGKKK